MVTQLQILSISLTLGRFGACADAVFRAVDLLSLHHNVLETLVVRVETVLQQLTESHRAAGKKKTYEKDKSLRYVARVEKRKKQFLVFEEPFYDVSQTEPFQLLP